MNFDCVAMGKRIAERRKNLGIKQNALAEQIGVSNNHLSGIERGQTTPSLDGFVKICTALDVTPDYLLLGTMHKNDIPKNIYDSLRLCADADIELMTVIVDKMVSRNKYNWNTAHH